MLCLHPACKTYHGVCSCRETYIEKTVRNVETRRNEHNMLIDQIESDWLYLFKNGIT